MYTCVVWKGNREIGKTLSLEEYFSKPHVAMRFTTQPEDSLSEWILHRTGRGQGRCNRRTYSLIPHLIVNTTRIATVHRYQANLYAKFLPIRIVDPSFEMPVVAERIQWHSFRNPDPGIAWLRKCMHEAAQNLTTGVEGNCVSAAIKNSVS